MMPLVSSDLAACYQLAQPVSSFMARKKYQWDGGGGRAYLRHAVHMAATMVGYRNGLGQQWLGHFSLWEFRQFFSEDEHSLLREP